MQRMETGKTQEQNTTAGKELYIHGMQNRNSNIKGQLSTT
jgi:hypothetical protein